MSKNVKGKFVCVEEKTYWVREVVRIHKIVNSSDEAREWRAEHGNNPNFQYMEIMEEDYKHE